MIDCLLTDCLNARLPDGDTDAPAARVEAGPPGFGSYLIASLLCFVYAVIWLTLLGVVWRTGLFEEGSAALGVLFFLGLGCSMGLGVMSVPSIRREMRGHYRRGGDGGER